MKVLSYQFASVNPDESPASLAPLSSLEIKRRYIENLKRQIAQTNTEFFAVAAERFGLSLNGRAK